MLLLPPIQIGDDNLKPQKEKKNPPSSMMANKEAFDHEPKAMKRLYGCASSQQPH